MTAARQQLLPGIAPRLQVAADRLLELGLPLEEVRRAMFAISPRPIERDVCSFCRKSLGVRPVAREIERRTYGTAAGPRTMGGFTKRVHMKPLQLVVSVRVEGADASDGPLPAALFHDGAFRAVAYRFCVKCAAGFVGGGK